MDSIGSWIRYNCNNNNSAYCSREKGLTHVSTNHHRGKTNMDTQQHLPLVAWSITGKKGTFIWTHNNFRGKLNLVTGLTLHKRNRNIDVFLGQKFRAGGYREDRKGLYYRSVTKFNRELTSSLFGNRSSNPTIVRFFDFYNI